MIRIYSLCYQLHETHKHLQRNPPSQLLRPPEPTSTPHMVGALSACTRRLCANNPAALNAVSFMDYTKGGGGGGVRQVQRGGYV